MKTPRNIDIKPIILLTGIISASADVIYVDSEGKATTAGNGAPQGQLVIETNDGQVVMALSDFDNIYKGFVKCWPAIKPVKELVIAEEREYLKSERAEKKEKEAQEKKAEKERLALEKKEAKEKAEKEKKEKAEEAKREREAKEAERKKTIEEGKAAALKLKERQAKEKEKEDAAKAKAAKSKK